MPSIERRAVLAAFTSCLIATGCGDRTSDVVRVTPQVLQQALVEGTATAVDVRGTSTYAQGHIKGALDIPLGEVEARLGELSPDKLIVFYCS